MSNDIPVGSPPAPPGRHAAPSGWYPDPADLSRDRYWDGWQWSREVRARSGPLRLPNQPRPPSQRRAETADGVPLAGWGWRVLAVIFDYVVTSWVVSFFTATLTQPFIDRVSRYLKDVQDALAAGSAMTAVEPISWGRYLPGLLSATAIAIAIAMVYHVLSWRYLAATPGQFLVGLRVVPLDQGKRGLTAAVVPVADRLGWGAVVLRAGLWVIPANLSILILFSAIDALWPLWQPKRQAIHDLAAKTQVVRVRGLTVNR